MRQGLAGGALLMVMTASCAAIPPVPPEDVPIHGGTGRTCAAGPAQAFLGRPATTEFGAEALRLSGAATLRWMRPGDIVTMDYREDRLNVELDAANRVRAVRCG